MVSGGDGNREKADVWLTTSEKLLAVSDFQGAKTFAIHACEADPSRADAADYILAISDTLLAGESTVGDSNLPDWYAILRLVRLTGNPEHIAIQYRRLALLLNPTVNRLPFADQALKLVSDAWCVLSDPPRKSMYDRELQLSQTGQFGQPHTQSEKFQPPKDPPLQSQAESAENPLATSFWTACPFCFSLFEYPKGYEECALRCQECKRAFEAVTTQTPPVESNGEGVYFCSWAMLPLGFSGHAKASSWSPISPLFACPVKSSDQREKMNAPPRNYVDVDVDDDDDIYVEISDDDDDDGRDGAKRNKKGG
uniref:Chaperone protein DnaJ n=2 Tax=Noccaea caerulescens TaxID=107243 RepID=A0A1J3E757_NOCCA